MAVQRVAAVGSGGSDAVERQQRIDELRATFAAAAPTRQEPSARPAATAAGAGPSSAGASAERTGWYA